MKLIKCDRCGKEITHASNYLTNTEQGLVRIDIYTFAHGGKVIDLDLCDECRKKVYDYIFDYGNGNNNGT